MTHAVPRFLRRSNLVRASAVLILLLAVLPNVLYLGHRPLFGDRSIHTQAQAREHAAHCHLRLSTCAGQAPLGQLLPSPEVAPFLPPDTFLSMADASDHLARIVFAHRPEKPPRLLA